MIEILGTAEAPVIFSVPHASDRFDGFSAQVALSLEQIMRFSDYGTADTVPRNGIVAIIAEHSRGLVDIARDPASNDLFPEYDFGRPERNLIWRPGFTPTSEQRQRFLDEIYHPYHQALKDRLKISKYGQLFVVDWHNTAQYVIGQDSSGRDVMMPSIILSNRGDEGMSSSTKGQTSCDPRLLDIMAEEFERALLVRELPAVVLKNTVFGGGHPTGFYNSRRHPAELAKLGITAEVQSIQVEYGTQLTHDQETLETTPARLDALRVLAEDVMKRTFGRYL